MLQWPAKDPDETLDYAIDWSAVLALDSDTISTVTWTLPAGFTLASQSHAAGVATVWISGGSPSALPYDIACRVVTAAGRTYDRTAKLPVARR